MELLLPTVNALKTGKDFPLNPSLLNEMTLLAAAILILKCFERKRKDNSTARAPGPLTDSYCATASRAGGHREALSTVGSRTFHRLQRSIQQPGELVQMQTPMQ